MRILHIMVRRHFYIKMILYFFYAQLGSKEVNIQYCCQLEGGFYFVQAYAIGVF